jgi:hypothetical protein
VQRFSVSHDMKSALDEPRDFCLVVNHSLSDFTIMAARGKFFSL